MGCVRFYLSARALAPGSGGPMNLQSINRKGATNIRYRPCFRVIMAAQVSGAEFRADPSIQAGGRMNKSRSLYEVLGLSREASAQDIKTAYRKLARRFHPDTATSSEEKSVSTEIFLQIQNAYAVLSKSEDRAQYDRQLVMQQWQRWNRASSRGAYKKPFGHVVRNWETDQCW